MVRRRSGSGAGCGGWGAGVAGWEVSGGSSTARFCGLSFCVGSRVRAGGSFRGKVGGWGFAFHHSGWEVGVFGVGSGASPPVVEVDRLERNSLERELPIWQQEGSSAFVSASSASSWKQPDSAKTQKKRGIKIRAGFILLPIKRVLLFPAR